MANSIPWHGQNKRLVTPAGEDKARIAELNIFNNGKCSVSCWQLTEAELVDIIQNGGKVFVACLYGPSQPPLFVGSEDTVRDVVIDFGGVWKRETKV